jgi:hypothetical protein
MKRIFGSLLTAAGIFVAGSAGAVSISGFGIVNDVSGPNELSFDADVTSASPILGTVLLDPGDTGPINFESVIFNSTALLFGAFDLVLGDGAIFAAIGDVTDGLGNFFPNVVGGGNAALVSFSPNEAFTFGGIEVGDPLELSGALDWAIDVSGVTGGSFGIELRPTLVPEPGSAALLALGLVALARRTTTGFLN